MEARHFERYCAKHYTPKPKKQPRKEIAAAKVLTLLQEFEGFCERNEKVTFWQKFKTVRIYGIFERKFLRKGTEHVITYLQSLFYQLKQEELRREIAELEQFLKGVQAKEKMTELTLWSLTYLRGFIYDRWVKTVSGRSLRRIPSGRNRRKS